MNILLSLVQKFLQFLAGFEVRDILLRHLHLLARFRVSSGTRRTIIQAETAEATNFDALVTILPRYPIENYVTNVGEKILWWYDAAKAAKLEQAK